MAWRDWPMHDLMGNIENARDWLRSAVDVACEDDIPEGAWPELDGYIRHVEAALKAVEALLPLPPTLASAYDREREEMDDGADRMEALRG